MSHRAINPSKQTEASKRNIIHVAREHKRAFAGSISAAIGRIKIWMLPTILAVTLASDPVIAGMVTAAYVIGICICTPIWARFFHVIGTRVMGVWATLAQVLGYGVLIWALSTNASKPALLLSAFIAGLAQWSIISLNRWMWARTIGLGDDLDIAYSWETAIDGISAVLGPVLAGLTCSMMGGPGAVTVAGTLTVTGSIMFFASIWNLDDHSDVDSIVDSAPTAMDDIEDNSAIIENSTEDNDDNSVDDNAEDNDDNNVVKPKIVWTRPLIMSMTSRLIINGVWAFPILGIAASDPDRAAIVGAALGVGSAIGSLLSARAEVRRVITCAIIGSVLLLCAGVIMWAQPAWWVASIVLTGLAGACGAVPTVYVNALIARVAGVDHVNIVMAWTQTGMQASGAAGNVIAGFAATVNPGLSLMVGGIVLSLSIIGIIDGRNEIHHRSVMAS